MEPYLDIRNAHVYNGNTKVFSGLNLQLFAGENTVILGPNGSGKTTLLKLLSRELYPVVREDSYVKIYGSERVVIWELRSKIGFVSQDQQNQYDAHILGEDVVLSGFFGSVGLFQHQLISMQQRELALHMMEKLQIVDLRKRYYCHLSTGQQRRFLLARALIHSPGILIFDEPTNGLDVKATFQLLQMMSDLAEEGKTLLLVTHHVQEIIPEITRTLLLKEGRIIADGNKHTLLTSKNLTHLYDTPVKVVESEQQWQIFPTLNK